VHECPSTFLCQLGRDISVELGIRFPAVNQHHSLLILPVLTPHIAPRVFFPYPSRLGASTSLIMSAFESQQRSGAEEIIQEYHDEPKEEYREEEHEEDYEEECAEEQGQEDPSAQPAQPSKQTPPQKAAGRAPGVNGQKQIPGKSGPPNRAPQSTNGQAMSNDAVGGFKKGPQRLAAQEDDPWSTDDEPNYDELISDKPFKP
jgi:hypothetical protein